MLILTPSFQAVSFYLIKKRRLSRQKTLFVTQQWTLSFGFSYWQMKLNAGNGNRYNLFSTFTTTPNYSPLQPHLGGVFWRDNENQ